MIVGLPLGRRNCILIGNILITIGGVIQAASYSVPQIIVARVLCVCHSQPVVIPCPFLLLQNGTNLGNRGLALRYADSSNNWTLVDN